MSKDDAIDARLDEDPELFRLLAAADPVDLGLLVDYLTTHRTRRGSRARWQFKLLESRRLGHYPDHVIRLLLAELMHAAHDRLAHLLRSRRSPRYLDVVRDVARHLNVVPDASDDVEVLEERILGSLLEPAWARMSHAERSALSGSPDRPADTVHGLFVALQLGGHGPYRISLFVAHAFGQSLTGRGLLSLNRTRVDRLLQTLAGPVAWAVSAVWTSFDLASPAHRVTVPCVVQIAYMRRKQSVRLCDACASPNQRVARYCNQCGRSLVPARSL